MLEFAFSLPVFIAMVFATMYASMLAFNYVGLRNAVEDAARCGAVRTGSTLDCPTTAKVQSYAGSRFLGTATTTPSFTPTANAACGYKVVGSSTFTLNLGLYRFSIPLSATACFPL